MGIKEEALVTELMETLDNRYFGTIKAHPDLWGVQEWKAMYKFREGQVKIAERRDKFLELKLSTVVNPKDGHYLRDNKDLEARLVIGFLKPYLSFREAQANHQ